MMKLFLLLCVAAFCLTEAKFEGLTQDEIDALNSFKEDLIKNKDKLIEESKHLYSAKSTDDPTFKTVPDLIRERGYPVENHQVVTKDGYVLTMHRIPYGKNDPNKRKKRKPLFLQHGLISSSATWILNTSDIAPAYILADAGYDIWMGNARGNQYSTRHQTLDTCLPNFWQFSWDEMGKYDLPAEIDYVLEHTGFKKLTYIGHSMGTTMFWVMMNEHPSYNDKIVAMFGLGPVAYVSNIQTPLKHFTYLMEIFDDVAYYLGFYQFAPNNYYFKSWMKKTCLTYFVEELACTEMIFFLTGYDRANFNYDLMPLISTHMNSGTSMNTVNHFAQEYNSHMFETYEYLWHESKNYNLSMVTCPLHLIYGKNDYFADPADVMRLASELPKKGNYIEAVPDPDFNHLDFLIGRNCKDLIYDKILKKLPHYYKLDQIETFYHSKGYGDSVDRDKILSYVMGKKQ